MAVQIIVLTCSTSQKSKRTIWITAKKKRLEVFLHGSLRSTRQRYIQQTTRALAFSLALSASCFDLTCPCILCVQLPETAVQAQFYGVQERSLSQHHISALNRSFMNSCWCWSLCVRRYRTRDSGFSCAHRSPYTCNQALSTQLKR